MSVNPIRSVEWTVAADLSGVTPTRPAAAGIQGEDRATRMVWHLGQDSPLLNPAYTLYFECINSAGEYDKSAPVTADSTGTIVWPVPLAWTQYGGISTVRLAAEADGQIVYTFEGQLSFAGRSTAVRQVDGLLRTHIQAAVSGVETAAAETAANAAEARKSASAAVANATTADSAARQASDKAALAGRSAESAAKAADRAAASADSAHQNEEHTIHAANSAFLSAEQCRQSQKDAKASADLAAAAMSSKADLDYVNRCFCGALQGLEQGRAVVIDSVSPSNPAVRLTLHSENRYRRLRSQPEGTYRGVRISYLPDGRAQLSGTVTEAGEGPCLMQTDSPQASEWQEGPVYRLGSWGDAAGWLQLRYTDAGGEHTVKSCADAADRCFALCGPLTSLRLSLVFSAVGKVYSGTTVEPVLSTGSEDRPYTPHLSTRSAVHLEQSGCNLFNLSSVTGMFNIYGNPQNYFRLENGVLTNLARRSNDSVFFVSNITHLEKGAVYIAADVLIPSAVTKCKNFVMGVLAKEKKMYRVSCAVQQLDRWEHHTVRLDLPQATDILGLQLQGDGLSNQLMPANYLKLCHICVSYAFPVGCPAYAPPTAFTVAADQAAYEMANPPAAFTLSVREPGVLVEAAYSGDITRARHRLSAEAAWLCSKAG